MVLPLDLRIRVGVLGLEVLAVDIRKTRLWWLRVWSLPPPRGDPPEAR